MVNGVILYPLTLLLTVGTFLKPLHSMDVLPAASISVHWPELVSFTFIYFAVALDYFCAVYLIIYCLFGHVFCYGEET